MKQQIILLSLLIIAFFGNIQSALSQECDLTLGPEIILIDGETLTIIPGDVVCLEAGNKDYLLIQNVHGTEENPITFINSGGAIIIDTDHFYGIKIAHSSFIKILGNGVEGIDYGIQVTRVENGSGVSIDDLSTDIEYAYTEIGNTMIAGLYAKTDPDCSGESGRGTFTMYNINIHHNYIHDTGDEGLYIGHSKYEQGVYLETCDTTIYPHLIHGLKVHHNIVEHTGWDGIQVACADNDCAVYDNIIRYDSEEEYIYQMSGILLGGGSRCDCYNNQIYDGKGDGIDVLGLGNFKVFNNLIVRAGRTYKPNDPNTSVHGIYVGDVVTVPGTEFKIYNNTIVSPKSYGITYNNFVASKTKIYNNFLVNPGKKSEGQKAFINNLTSASKLDLMNNINSVEIAHALFKDANNDNYYPTQVSPSVDFGTNLLSEGISFDIQHYGRPFNTYFDVGAYEWTGPSAIITNQGIDNLVSELFPNPASNYVSFKITTETNELIEINILSSSGQKIMEYEWYCNARSETKIELDLPELEKAVYFMEVITSDGAAYRKLIID